MASVTTTTTRRYNQPGDDEEVARQAKLERLRVLREQGPSTRQQTMGFVNWGGMGDMLGQPHSALRVPLSKLYEMRRDPMLAFALSYIKVPLIRAPWYVKCEDAQVAAFVDGALRRIYGPLMLALTNSLDFGYQALEKRFEADYVPWKYVDPDTPEEEKPVWANGPVKALVWKEPIAVPPDTVEPLWTDDGEFDGFAYFPGTPPNSPFRLKSKDHDASAEIDIDHALWFSNERHSVFGSLWGYPRLSYAARFWWSYWFRWALADRAFERFSDPALMVWYPDDYVIDDATGEPVNAREQAMIVGESIRSGATVTIPNQQVVQDDGRIVGPAWKIEPLETNTEFQTYQEAFNYLDVMKLRSLMVPEQALIEGAQSSSKNVAAEYGDLFFQGQAVLKEEIDNVINRFMIPQLVRLNFPERKVKAELVTRGFAATDTALSKQILTLIGQADPTKLPADVREMMEQNGIPTLSPTAVAKEAEKAAKEAEAANGGGFQMVEEGGAPTQTPEGQGGNSIDPNAANASVNADGTNFGPAQVSHVGGRYADVDALGRYIQQRKVLFLGPVKKKLKGTPLEEAEVIPHAEAIFDAWVQAFQDAYSDFAAALERDETLGLAEKRPPDEGTPEELAAAAAAAGLDAGSDEEEAFQIAHLIVSEHGGVVTKAMAKAHQKTAGNVAQIVDAAAKKELERATLDPVVWNMDNPSVVEWMREHGAGLVRNVSETVRAELRAFIAKELAKTQDPKEIAKAIAGHFSQWPGWKAMRLARTEAAHAYNEATLLAGRAAGIERVQASDASGGRNLHTDAACIHRHGRIYKIEDAPYEDFHPNGTLGWRLIPNDVELEDGQDIDLALGMGKWNQYLHPRGGAKNKGQFTETPDPPAPIKPQSPMAGVPQAKPLPGMGGPAKPRGKALAGDMAPGTRFMDPATGSRYKVTSKTKTHVLAKRHPDGATEWMPHETEVQPHPDDVPGEEKPAVEPEPEQFGKGKPKEAGGWSASAPAEPKPKADGGGGGWKPAGGTSQEELDKLLKEGDAAASADMTAKAHATMGKQSFYKGPAGAPPKPAGDPLVGKQIGGGAKKGGSGAVPDYNDVPLTLGKGAGGSNGARWAFDADGNRWLVKAYRGNQDRVGTELLANAVYRKLGLKVADAGQMDVDGKPAVAYKALDGAPQKIKAPNETIGKGFMADALVGNWDVIGLEDDNVLWAPDGQPFRVDQGGTFQFRAMGQSKPFGPVPTEVWTMRGLKKDGSPTQATRGMRVTEQDMRQQAQRIGDTLSDVELDALVDAAPFKSEAMREDIRENLKARVQWMRDYAAGSVDVPRAPEGDDALGILDEGTSGDFQMQPEEVDALETVMADGAAGVNEYLRNPETPDNPEMDATIEAMDGFLKDVRTPAEVSVYRGLDVAGMGYGTPDELVGKTLADKGFLLAQADRGRVGGTALRIKVPAGAHVAHAASLDERYEPGTIITRRGSRVRIHAVNTAPDGTVILEGTML